MNENFHLIVGQEPPICLYFKSSLTCQCKDFSITCVGAQSAFTEVSLRDEIFSGWLEKNASTLKALKISISHLEPIPDFAFSKLSNLQLLSLTKAKYSNISDNIFSGLNESLTDLSLKYNDFHSVPKGALRDLKALTSLDLSDNSIVRIEGEDFIHQPLLKKLDLSNNEIQFIAPDSFINQQELETLMLQDNKLEVIGSDSFRGLSDLKVLFLASNRLLSITKDNVYPLKSLEHLYLANNNILSLENIQLDLPSLRTLCLKNNSLSGEVNNEAFSKVPSLRDLILGHNSLSRISSTSFSALPHLNWLDLSFNSLLDLPDDAFSNNTNLVQLDLQENNLQVISPWAFRRLFKLNLLNLATNFLSNLECSHTLDLQSLTELNLNHNYFTSLSSIPFRFTPNLALLHLKDNPFDCECFLLEFINFLKVYPLPQKYKDLAFCHHPYHLKGKKLVDVQLDCPSYSAETCDSLTLKKLASQMKIIFGKMLWDGYLFQLIYHAEGLNDVLVPHSCHLILSSQNQTTLSKFPVPCPRALPQTFKYALSEIAYDLVCLEFKFQNGNDFQNCSSIVLDESQRIGAQGGSNIVHNILSDVIKPKVGFSTPNISISLQNYDKETTMIHWTIQGFELLSESCILKVALIQTDNKIQVKNCSCANDTLFINEILLARLQQVCIVVSYRLLDKHVTHCISIVHEDVQEKEQTFDIPYYPIGAVSLVFLIALIIMIILLIQRTCQKQASYKSYKVHFEKEASPNNVKKVLEEEEAAAFLDGHIRPPQGKLFTFSAK